MMVLDKRLAFVDGLRGVAALMVVAYHLYGNIRPEIGAILPKLLDQVLQLGYLGVYVFFVISGFVISLNIGDRQYDGSYLARFALRRSIRLDPPYWVSIAIAIVLAMIAGALFPALDKTLPSLGQIIAHLFYAQHFLGYGDIVPIYWTLCFEIQFYIVLVALLWLTQRVSHCASTATTVHTRLFLGVGSILLLISLAQHAKWIDWLTGALFTHSWFAFFLGACCLFWLRFNLSPLFLGIILLITCAASFAAKSASMAVAVFVSLSLIWSGRSNRMHTLLAGPVSQFFGRISYSLYLLHPTIGWSTMSLAKKLLGENFGPAYALGIFSAGFAASVVSAYLAYRFVEKPSVALSKRVLFDHRRWFSQSASLKSEIRTIGEAR